ncbi:hypothetical protein MF406_03580 [Georgenia sp. TF02-10]|nr:hypothetical protein [Georgenia sp. TF02-10]UNX55363.1 hypothetical protein MF406_03580 [Georgenia sp. TF02-10]
METVSGEPQPRPAFGFLPEPAARAMVIPDDFDEMMREEILEMFGTEE